MQEQTKLFELVPSEVSECSDMEKSVRRLGRECGGGMMHILGKSHKATLVGAEHKPAKSIRPVKKEERPEANICVRGGHYKYLHFTNTYLVLGLQKKLLKDVRETSNVK